jgi:hypothetical protein
VKRLYVQATCSNGAPGFAPWDSQLYYAQAYAAPDGSNRRVLLISKSQFPITVTVPGADGQTVLYVDESTGDSPPAKSVSASDSITLTPFCVMIVFLS